MTYATAKLEAATSNGLGGGKHLYENTLFDLELGVKVTQDAVQCPLHHVTYYNFIVFIFGGIINVRRRTIPLLIKRALKNIQIISG